jgi:hypothetical protein
MRLGQLLQITMRWTLAVADVLLSAGKGLRWALGGNLDSVFRQIEDQTGVCAATARKDDSEDRQLRCYLFAEKAEATGHRPSSIESAIGLR